MNCVGADLVLDELELDVPGIATPTNEPKTFKLASTYTGRYTLPAYFPFMPVIENKSVIDLGCGEGSNTRRFAQLGGKMTASIYPNGSFSKRTKGRSRILLGSATK